MIIEDIYKDNILKYPLTDKEYYQLEEVWEFLDVFKKSEIFVTEYRRKIINSIRKKYTMEEFYLYESILNKMFWNLRWLIFPLWYKSDMDESGYDKFVKSGYGNFKNIPNSLLLCEHENYKDDVDLQKKIDSNPLFETTYYRSFINKLIIVDKKNKTIITKPMEGKSHIFRKNYFNLFTMTIMFDKKLYEKIMTDPYSSKFVEVDISNHYYQYDYPFPNLNFCVYNFGTENDRKNRIQKMYYYGKPKGSNWFKLII